MIIEDAQPPVHEREPRHLSGTTPDTLLIIAGTYTPQAVLLLPTGQQAVLLSLVWAGAAAGIAFRVWWIRAPRWLYTLAFVHSAPA